MHSGRAGQSLRRSQPIRRNGQFRVRRRNRISAGISPYQSARTIEDFERNWASRGRLQVIVEDGSIRRILARGLVWWQRRVAVGVPANAIGQLGRKQESVAGNNVFVQLTQRRDVVEDPETPAMGSYREIVVLNGQVAD